MYKFVPISINPISCVLSELVVHAKKSPFPYLHLTFSWRLRNAQTAVTCMLMSDRQDQDDLDVEFSFMNGSPMETQMIISCTIGPQRPDMDTDKRRTINISRNTKLM